MRTRSLLLFSLLPGFVAMAVPAGAVTGIVEVQTPAASGATPPTVATTPAIANSSENFLGDRLSWDEPIVLRALTTNGGVDLTTGYCLPAHVRVQGLASAFVTAAAQTTPKDASNPTTTTPNNYLLARLNPDRLLFGLVGAQPTDAPLTPVTLPGATPSTMGITPAAQERAFELGTACNAFAVTGSNPPKLAAAFNPIEEGTEFYISQGDTDNAALRTGWDFGALAVPFKIQLSKTHSFTGSATVGAYVGYRMPFGDLDLNFTPIAFAGASNISTSATTGGTTTSQTVAGLSYGFGVIGKIKDSFQFGLVIGADHVDSAQPYKYNDKPWISFGLGYSFSQ